MKRQRALRRIAFLSLMGWLAASTMSAQVVPVEASNHLNWRLIGPLRAGRVVAVGGVAGTSDFYFGSADGGVWKSGDAGMVWQPTFNGPPVASVGAPGVAPSDPKVLYAGIGENDIRSDLSLGGGVYRSSDGASRSTKPFLYQSATAIRLDHDAFPATRVPVDEPTAKNPLEGALIDYYLLTAASKITLTVYDSSKQLVRTYSSDNMQVPRQRAAVVASPWYTHKEPLATNEGMHRFEWSLNCDATGSPEADLSDAGFGGGPAPRGPHALPGISG